MPRSQECRCLNCLPLAVFLMASMLAFNADASVNVTLMKRRYSAEVRQMAPAERCVVLRKLQTQKNEWRFLLIVLVLLPPLIFWGYEWRYARRENRKFDIGLSVLRDRMFWKVVAVVGFLFWLWWYDLSWKIEIVQGLCEVQLK